MEQVVSPLGLSGVFIIPANGEVPYDFVGTFVRCIDSTGQFRLAVGDDTTGMVMEKGLAYEAPDGESFTSFRLINTTGAPITATISFGRGRVQDNRLVVGSGLSIAGGTIVNQGGQNLSNNTVSVLATATQILAADSTGTGYTLYHNGNDTVYVGDAAVTAGTGYPLKPGDRFAWDCRAALYGISPTAGQDIRYLKGVL